MRFVLCTFLLASMMGCASTERTDWASNGYHAEERKISALVEADKIGIGEANAEMLQVSKAYFPNDARLANHWIYAIDLASQARDGKITPEKYFELVKQSWDRFYAINVNIIEENKAIAGQQRNSQFIGNFLGSMGNRVNRIYQQPVTCASTSMPGVVTTNCR